MFYCRYLSLTEVIWNCLSTHQPTLYTMYKYHWVSLSISGCSAGSCVSKLSIYIKEVLVIMTIAIVSGRHDQIRWLDLGLPLVQHFSAWRLHCARRFLSCLNHLILTFYWNYTKCKLISKFYADIITMFYYCSKTSKICTYIAFLFCLHITV